MENAGNIGSRRREGKKYAVEDEALDRIAKEVSECSWDYFYPSLTLVMGFL